jgi:hypothetical protein
MHYRCIIDVYYLEEPNNLVKGMLVLADGIMDQKIRKKGEGWVFGRVKNGIF